MTSARVITFAILAVFTQAVEKPRVENLGAGTEIVRRRSKKYNDDVRREKKAEEGCAAVVTNLTAEGYRINDQRKAIGAMVDHHIACFDEHICAQLPTLSIRLVKKNYGELQVAYDLSEKQETELFAALLGYYPIAGNYQEGMDQAAQKSAALAQWWCSLPIDRSRPIMFVLGDVLKENPRSELLLSTLSKLRVPIAGPSAKKENSILMHETLAPRYAFDKVVLLPDALFIASGGYTEMRKNVIECRSHKMPFEHKKPVIVFRGSGTGYTPDTASEAKLRRNERARAAMLTKGLPGWDVGFVKEGKFTGWAPSAITYLNNSGFVKDAIDECEMQTYQGVMDIDGNSNAWDGFFSKLLMSSVIVKMRSPYRQWYYHALRPGVDYIEVDPDMSEREQLPALLASLGQDKGRHLVHKQRTLEAEELMSYDGVSRIVAEWWAKLAEQGS